jgi:hypothetical protein
VVAVDRVVVEVLADERGVVAGVLQPRGEVRPLVEVLVAGRAEVLNDPGVMRVLAGEDRRARRAALRSGDERVREGHAVRAEQPLHVRHP